MDFFQEGGGGNAGRGGGGVAALVNAARGQTLRYSNFLITISTNVRPHDEDEKDALVEWLLNHVGELFSDFDRLNGNVLKPPGTQNADMIAFPADNKIIKISSRISVEQGDFQKGQIHAHVLLEVAHQYVNQEDGAQGNGNDTNRPHLGVHVNVFGLRNYLNRFIPDMNLAPARLPPKIYVNCRLLTKGTDNSNKFLTLQYLNKDRAKDNGGGHRDLRADERAGDPALAHIREGLLNGVPDIGHDPETTVIQNNPEPPNWREDDRLGLGGSLSPDLEAPSFRRTTIPAPSFIRTTSSAPNFVRTTQPRSGPRKF